MAAEAGDWLQFVKAETSVGALRLELILNLELGPELKHVRRDARYDAVMTEVEQGDVVMTAHHRDDQVETLLIRLSQGSGLVGLAGIPVTRPFGLGVLIRPLLSLSRQQLKQVLAVRNLRHVVDLSNQDPTYLRNYIRLQFLPALSRVAPVARDQLLQLSKVATKHVFVPVDLRRICLYLVSILAVRQHHCQTAGSFLHKHMGGTHGTTDSSS